MFLKALLNLLNYSRGNGGGALIKYGTSTKSNAEHYMLVGVSSFGPRECGTRVAPGKNLLCSI